MSTPDGNELSQLEREYELEMGGDDGGDRELDDELDEELGVPDAGDALGEFEALREQGGERELGEPSGDFAERFYELAQREFESERELEAAIGGIVDDMEREYFFGGLMKKISRAGKGLLKKGVALAAQHVPALQAVKGITQLARGNLKGMLGNLAKAAIGSFVPGASAFLPALGALGLKLPGGSSGGGMPSLADMRRLVGVSREAFDHLAHELTESSDQPVEAAQVAATAFQKAVRSAPLARAGLRTQTAAQGGGRVHRVRVSRGDKIVIQVV